MLDCISLTHTFVLGFFALQNPIRPAFAFTLFGRFLTFLSWPLGASDALLEAWRPTQTAHQLLSLQRGKRQTLKRIVLHFRRSSYLLCTVQSLLQQQAVVKLHRDYSSHWKSLAYSPEREFARFQSGTLKTSLDLHAGRRLIGKGLRYLSPETAIKSFLNHMTAP